MFFDWPAVGARARLEGRQIINWSAVVPTAIQKARSFLFLDSLLQVSPKRKLRGFS